ncbi:MAG: PDZ domain-containing protein [Actinobacteria bacterium]|nr:MAG: PDZ domain-containing protein [Actinomycetota bacterium]
MVAGMSENEPQQRTWYGAPSYGMPQVEEKTPPQGYPSQPAPTRPRRGTRMATTGLLALLLAGGGGVVGGLVVHSADSHTGTTSTTAASSGPTAVKVMDRSSLADIAAAVKPSVVDIRSRTGEGSGVIFDAKGYIVTNNHVVADVGAGGTVQVNFSDGRSASASVTGTDPKTDLAVVKVSGVTGLAAATWGDSGMLRVGDTVLAIGSPLGLQGSVTAGIVSALDRTIQEGGEPQQNQSTPQTTDIAGAIQTDAAINPGNSGGALVDVNGHVIGINTAIATSGQNEGNIGVGFAIPGNLVQQVANTLKNGQKVSHPYLGVSVTSADNNGGAVVAKVAGGSPAEQAGLQTGDVVTKAGSKDIHTSDDLVGAVQSSKAGEKLALTVVRGGTTRTISVTIGNSS